VNKFFKRVTCWVLICLLAVSPIFYEEKKADAFLPALIAAAPYIATALVAGAGVTYLNQDTILPACADFWDRTTEDVRTYFSTCATNATTDILLTGVVCNALADYQHSLVTGEITTLPISANDLYTWTSTGQMANGAQYFYSGSAITEGRVGMRNIVCPSIAYSKIYVGYMKGAYTYSFNVGFQGKTVNGVNQWYPCINASIYDETRASGDMWDLLEFVVTSEGFLEVYADGVLFHVFNDAVYKMTGKITSYPGTASYTSTDISTINYSVEPLPVSENLQVSAAPTNYYEKKVTVVNNYTELVNETPEDLTVTTPTVEELDHAVDPITGATDTGILSGILTSVRSLASHVTAIATSVTSITSTTALDDPATSTINFEPLKFAGTLLTTKFPFSLPFDFYNSFASLDSSSTWQPIFHINIPPFFVFDIDLSLFNPIVVVARIFELLFFDITLILQTRKLLGGAV